MKFIFLFYIYQLKMVLVHLSLMHFLLIQFFLQSSSLRHILCELTIQWRFSHSKYRPLWRQSRWRWHSAGTIQTPDSEHLALGPQSESYLHDAMETTEVCMVMHIEKNNNRPKKLPISLDQSGSQLFELLVVDIIIIIISTLGDRPHQKSFFWKLNRQQLWGNYLID